MKLISVLRFQICMSSHRDAFGAALKLSKSSRTLLHHDMCELLTSIGFHLAWNFIVRSPLAESKQSVSSLHKGDCDPHSDFVQSAAAGQRFDIVLLFYSVSSMKLMLHIDRVAALNQWSFDLYSIGVDACFPARMRMTTCQPPRMIWIFSMNWILSVKTLNTSVDTRHNASFRRGRCLCFHNRSVASL